MEGEEEVEGLEGVQGVEGVDGVDEGVDFVEGVECPPPLPPPPPRDLAWCFPEPPAAAFVAFEAEPADFLEDPDALTTPVLAAALRPCPGIPPPESLGDLSAAFPRGPPPGGLDIFFVVVPVPF